MDSDSCLITVVLCTYNRAERVERVVRAVLAQVGCDFELVVVDDGSTDATPTILASIEDDRLRKIRRPNGGPCAARNTGLEHARGRWTVFLDDDDLPEDGWLATFAGPMTNPRIGITCCGATLVDTNGHEIEQLTSALSEEMAGDLGMSLAGAFAARTDLLRRAGGYLDGLGTAEQSELFIRLLALARCDGLIIASEDSPKLRIEERPITNRPMRNPRRLFDGARWILARYPTQLAGKRTAVARFEGIAGTAGAKLGEWQAARRHLRRSVRALPASWKGWGRLALASAPVVGRRVWNDYRDIATHDSDEIGIRRQRPDDVPTVQRELFLAWRYRENSPSLNGNAQSQTPVHQLGVRLARKHRWARILDLSRIDGDLDDEATWEGLEDLQPDLIICANLIERVEDPVEMLHHLTRVSGGRSVLLSTADRERCDPDRPLGPPSNPDNQREWTRDQFELLLLSTGFAIERTWCLPRRWYTLKLPIRRARRRRREPDTHATMVFLVRSRLP